jgi:surface carbohydrate biosynthesis protein (TIGR04326 family)
MALSVIVWDQKEAPPAVADKVLCWQSYTNGSGISSVPQYLEDHGARIRQKYLAFIHDLGECRIAGKRVVDHLDIGDGFSLWWMTHLAEKSPLKSPRIYDCLRLIALEEILAEDRPSHLTLITGDRALAQAMRKLCRNTGIDFRSRMRGGSTRVGFLRRLYDALPSSVRGLLSLRHVVMRWPLRRLTRPQWFSGKNAVFICSYFIHLDPTRCAHGQFHSRQWEGLPKSLHENGKPLNWIQLFIFNAVVPDLATGLRWLRQFNHDAGNQGWHAFLESYMTFSFVLRVLKNWLWLNYISWHLRDIRFAFYPDGSAVWLWPILRADWQTSLNGPIAISNCLWIALFDAALADIPQQTMGLYLCENQGWEKAFLRAWRKHGHGKIFGVQHATVPFWHLYYFDDPRSLKSRQGCALPLPDLLAVNGLAAWEAFVDGSYPEERLVEVEALRYLNFAGIVARGGEERASRLPKPSGSEVVRVNVIVLGDMVPTSMHHFLGLLEETCKFLSSSYRFTFKPHPGYSVRLADYPGLKADETKEPLGEILGAYDVAVSANSTSASVDAYLTGIPVIIGLDGNDLNLSPLRGRRGVRFVSTSADLVDALEAAAHGIALADTDRRKFFFLDSDLTRWKRLLAYGNVV